MPGLDLGHDLPQLSDNLSTMVSKTAIALSEIEDDLEPKITPSEIDIQGELAFNGNPITELGYLTLVPGNATATPGSVYYLSGNFHLVTSVGAVQLTDGAALNIAVNGGIGGDYPTTPGASVSFDNSANKYAFVQAPGIFSDVEVESVILQGTTGSVTTGVHADITTDRIFNFGSLPSAGVSLLAYDASDSTLRAAEDVTINNDVASNGEIEAATLRATTAFEHDFEHSKRLSLHNGVGAGGIGSVVASPWQQTTELLAGDRIKTIKVAMTNPVGATVKLYRVLTDGSLSLVESFNHTTSGTQTHTITTPAALATDEDWVVEIDKVSGDDATLCSITWDRPGA